MENPDDIEDPESWALELGHIRAYNAAAKLAPRALLLLHGAEDQMVPVLDARALADSHGDGEMVLIAGADHGLRHDPRAIASLLGWLDRQAGHVAIGDNPDASATEPGSPSGPPTP